MVGFVWHLRMCIVETQWVFWVYLGFLGLSGLSGFICFSDLSILAFLCVCACRYEGRKV